MLAVHQHLSVSGLDPPHLGTSITAAVSGRFWQGVVGLAAWAILSVAFVQPESDGGRVAAPRGGRPAQASPSDNGAAASVGGTALLVATATAVYELRLSNLSVREVVPFARGRDGGAGMGLARAVVLSGGGSGGYQAAEGGGGGGGGGRPSDVISASSGQPRRRRACVGLCAAFEPMTLVSGRALHRLSFFPITGLAGWLALRALAA